jgi:hypothetical protein
MTLGDRSRVIAQLALAATFTTPSTVAHGQGGRAALTSQFVDESHKQPPLYQASPVTHIVPAFNTVTYALEAHLFNTEVTPESYRSGEELRIDGYSYEPYIVLSLKQIGLGFNVDGGHREITYESSSAKQQSRLDYRGLGVFGFFKLYDKPDLYSTLIVGGRSLSARHEVGETRYGESAGGRTFDYGLTGYETGLNVGMRLVKPMTIIPWANYAYTDDSKGRAVAERSDSRTMKEDLDLFWKAERPLNYGLDFALRVANVELRIGGLLGLVVSSGTGSDAVEDNSYSLCIAWDQKG